MNVQETAKLLAVVVAYDGRQVGESTVAAWYDVLRDLPYDQCEEAVRLHYRNDPGWLMPSQVRSLVKNLRNERASRTALTAAIEGPRGVEPNGEYVAARGQGRDPERVKALTVSCPHCPAWPGQWCQDVDGKPLRESSAHPSRIEKAGCDPQWAVLGRSPGSKRSDPSGTTGTPRSPASVAPSRVSAGDWQTHQAPDAAS